EDGESGRDEPFRALGVERYAEVRADQARDTVRSRLLDHRIEVPAEQRLAPVAELHAPEIRGELPDHSIVQLGRQVSARSPDLSVAGEAGGTAEVADIGDLDDQLDRTAAQPGVHPVVLPAVQPEVQQATWRHPRALVPRMLEEAPDRARRVVEACDDVRSGK